MSEAWKQDDLYDAINEIYLQKTGREVDAEGFRNYKNRYLMHGLRGHREAVWETLGRSPESYAYKNKEAAFISEDFRPTIERAWNSETQSAGTKYSLDNQYTFNIHRQFQNIYLETGQINEENLAAMEQIKTDFVDELYGTNKGWASEDPADMDVGAIEAGEVVNTGDRAWGLDLRRRWDRDYIRDTYGKDELEVGSAEYYENTTRGKIDWAHYANDGTYQKAYRRAVDSGWADLDGKDGITSVAEIRHFNSQSNVLDKKTRENMGIHGWWHEWSGKYKDAYDPNLRPEFQPVELDVTYTDKQAGYSFNPNEQETGKPFSGYSEGTFTKVDTPSQVTKPDLKVNKVEVKRPANIPATWSTK